MNRLGQRPEAFPLADSMLGEMADYAYAQCIPLHVTLELTLRCNVRCVHCYNFDRPLPRPQVGPELTLEEIRRLMDDLREAGTLFLSITGGEALAHPGIWAVLDEAAARSFAVTLLTNGTLLTEAVCDRLAAYPNLHGASISLYGGRPETNDAITRAPGSFRRTIEGIDRLLERRVAVNLKVVILRENAAEVAQMIAIAEGRGAPFMADATITGRYDGTAGSLESRVDHETLDGLYRGPLRALVRKGPADPSDEEFKCNCARANAAVSSTGEVYPCIATPLSAGNIRNQPFPEIWRDSPLFRRIRELRVADFPSCAPCGLKAWCQHSPSAPAILNGEFTGIDPWVCGEAEVIRKILG